MSYNKSGTFIYSPDVSVVIATKDGILDVSSDVIDFYVQRNINAVSTLMVTLSNSNRKYNRKINTMDRITVFLKRTKFVQVFTGYVTMAPIETLVPTPITLNAACTLRNLQVTYWDNTLIEYQSLLLNYMDGIASSSDQTLNDGGVAQVIVNLLYKVAGWDTSRIHIAPIPQKFLDFTASVYRDLSIQQADVSEDIAGQVGNALGASSIVAGKNVSVGHYTYGMTQTVKNSSAPNGGQGTKFTVSKAVALKTKKIDPNGKDYFPSRNSNNPVDIDLIKENIYYCSLPFSFMKMTDQNKISQAMSWIAHNKYGQGQTNGNGSYDGRLLILENTKHNRIVVLRATSVTQKVDNQGNLAIVNGKAVGDPDANYAQCHPGVVAYLNGDISDPTAWNSNTKVTADFSYINIAWANESQVQSVGPQKSFEKNLEKNALSLLGIDPNNSTNSSILTNAIDILVMNARMQLGATYTNNSTGAHTRETPNNPYTGTGGSFDCSGLTQWAYRQIGIHIGSNTWNQWGSGSNSDANTHGFWIDPHTRPQRGDLLFWSVPNDGGNPPQHVSLLSAGFNVNGIGSVIQAHGKKQKLDESTLKWSDIKGGKTLYKGTTDQVTYMGARRPITLHQSWGNTPRQNTSVVSTPSTTNTTTTNKNGTTVEDVDTNQVNNRSILSLTNAWNTPYLSPNWDVNATAIQGTPNAILLDNPLMQDLDQVVRTGLRSYMSAPNGDFVAWFPDYYGMYGMDPVIEISDVEIIDFQIYHNDDALVTHVGIIGDTTGIGQQVNLADLMTNNGIVSIQDTSTMQLLFGTLWSGNTTNETNAQKAIEFLNRYGIRIYQEQQNVIHSHALEYMYALQTFMYKWTQQFSSYIQLSFMPELYPGMRVVINIDNESGGQDRYEFYCEQVIHQGSRSSGYMTNAYLTAPKKNGKLLHYGIEFVS